MWRASPELPYSCIQLIQNFIQRSSIKCSYLQEFTLGDENHGQSNLGR
jgi:hypothetical protein